MNLQNEILLNKARLAEMKKRFQDMEDRAESYITIIREIIDPYGGEFTELDMDKAIVMVVDFRILWVEARKLKGEIAKLEKSLGV